MANKKLLIAIPTFSGQVDTDVFKSIYGLTKPTGVDVLLDFCKGYDVAKARNNICQEALGYEFDWLLMVDSDMILPSSTLINLLSHGLPIVFGWYPRRCTSIRNIARKQTELFKPGVKDFTDENNFSVDEIPSKGLLEIKGGGMGCSLIDCKVLEDLMDEKGMWFKYVQYDKDTVLSEDNYFCSKATSKGYKIYVDCSVRCGHISKLIL